MSYIITVQVLCRNVFYVIYIEFMKILHLCNVFNVYTHIQSSTVFKGVNGHVARVKM